MKSITSLVLAMLFGTAFCSSTRGEWKFVSFLRGETEPIAPRRVAFVGSAVVRESSGQVEKRVGSNDWRTLDAGEQLQPGDLIRTRTASVVLKMKESGSFVRVGTNTILRLVAWEPGWDRSVLTGREEQSGFVVRSCRGMAFFRDGSVSWQPIEVNTVLPDSAEVRTTADATVDLFSTGSRKTLRVEGRRRVLLSEIPRNPSDTSRSFASVGH